MTGISKRILLIVSGTILLPIILFVVYEITSLQEDEEMIQAVYESQLDFVIFSANQFSNDFLSNLVSSLEENLQADGTLELTEKTRTLVSYSGAEYINVKSLDSSQMVKVQGFPMGGNETYLGIVNDMHDSKQPLIRQLMSYKQNDYTKIQPDNLITVPKVEPNGEKIDLQVLFAILSDPGGRLHLLTALIQPSTYANDVLSPRLQQVAQQNMVISLIDEVRDTLVYRTDDVAGEIIASKPMWLFPSLDLGISLKNKSLQELVDQRMQYNLAASLILIATLLLGLALVARMTIQQMRLAQTKSDFVSNVSHELRTPLALISMFAETLLLGRVKTEEKKSEYIEIIFKETNRLTRIVNRILNFAQIDAERKKFSFEETDLNAVVDELVHDYSFHLEQKDFGVSVEKDDTITPVRADKESIYEALVNLIDNAIKYSEDDRHITIRTRGDNGHALIEVADRGIGIPKDKKAQIFDKFYRISEGNVHTVQGAGLGLSLVYSIMQAHEGTVQVESELGRGSTFKLVFNQN